MIITVSLRQPSRSTPLQKWTFNDVAVIKIGRASDNDVILHSSVVSRYHVELRYIRNHWEVISLGNNGTYHQGALITQVPVVDGMIIGLAISGPQIQINLGETTQKPMQRTLPSKRSVSPAKTSTERATFLFFSDDEDEE
jgi:serine/threonine-protein kinase